MKLHFEYDQEKKHTIRYKEIPPTTGAYVLSNIYVQKWFAEDAETLTVEILKGTEAEGS